MFFTCVARRGDDDMLSDDEDGIDAGFAAQVDDDADDDDDGDGFFEWYGAMGACTAYCFEVLMLLLGWLVGPAHRDDDVDM